MEEEVVEGTEEDHKDTNTVSAHLSYEYSSSVSFEYVISFDLPFASPISDFILLYCTLLYTASLCISLHSAQLVTVLCDSTLNDSFLSSRSVLHHFRLP